MHKKEKNIEASYVLITPARDEEAYIEKTIQSVISQTILPKKWIIVSDRSTDRTDDIVNKYVLKFDFIELLRFTGDTDRNFGSKSHAINKAFEKLQNIDFNYLGILDADISFEPQYYKKLLEKFEKNPKLGIAGGLIYNKIKNGFKNISYNLNSVGGAIQMFRLKCYEDIGGYLPLKLGGIDAAAEVLARIHSWEVKTFPDLKVFHYRPIGIWQGNIYSRCFNRGIMEYSHRYHPLFEIAKCIYYIPQKPFFWGSLLRLSGYCWAFLRRDKPVLPNNVIKFLRTEQIRRLWIL